MSFWSNLLGKKPKEIVGVVIPAIYAHTEETAPHVQGLCQSSAILQADDVHLGGLKRTLTSQFHQAVCADGAQEMICDNGQARIRMWSRDNHLPENMILWREEKNGDVYTTTHIMYGAKAAFSAVIVPPCCDGESVLTCASGTLVKVNPNTRALELDVPRFFADDVRIVMATNRERLDYLEWIYAQFGGSQPG